MIPSKFGYAGRDGYVADREIDLYFVRRRHYDPDAGRFVSEDPSGYAPDLNLYRYCGNDPVNHTDPSGLDTIFGKYNPFPESTQQLQQQVIDPIATGATQVSNQITTFVGQQAAPYVDIARQQADRLRDAINGYRPRFEGCQQAIHRTGEELLRNLLTGKAGNISLGSLEEAKKPTFKNLRNYGCADAAGKTIFGIRALKTAIDHPWAQMLPGYGRIAAPLKRVDWDESLWVVSEAEKACKDPKAYLGQFKDSETVKAVNEGIKKLFAELRSEYKMALRTGPKKTALRLLDRLEEAMKGQSEEAEKILAYVLPAARSVIAAAAEPPPLSEDAILVLDEIGGYVFDAAEAKVLGMVNYFAGGDWWDDLETTIGEQIWPWGPPFHDHGIIDDLQNGFLPLVESSANYIWHAFDAPPGCSDGDPFGRFVKNLRGGVNQLSTGLNYVNGLTAKLDLWVWAGTQIVGSILPGAGNEVAADIAVVAEWAVIGTQFGSEMVVILGAVYDLYESFDKEDVKAQDADDAAEAAQARIDGVDEELSEDDPEVLVEWEDAPEPESYLLGAAVGAVGAAGASESGPEADGASRADNVEAIMDASVILASLLPGVLIGGAVIGFAKRAVENLKKYRKKVKRPKKPHGKKPCKKKPCQKKPHRCKKPKNAPATPRTGGRACQCPNKRFKCSAGSCPTGAKNCFVRGTVVDRNWKIEDAELGRELRTWLPGESGYAEFVPQIVAVREREICLTQEENGVRTEVWLLRSESWFADNGVSAVGDRMELDLPELGVVGEFQVMELGGAFVSTQLRRAGFGRVTGRFRFSRGKTVNLYIEGESQPLGVTKRHPFWSADRNAWVSVLDLRIGERLLVEGGTRVVEKVEVRGEEAVFNIEVEGEHCYRVGEQGVLVHNASPGYPNLNPTTTTKRPCVADETNCARYKPQLTAPKPYKDWTDYVSGRCGGSKSGIMNAHGHHIVMKGDAFEWNAKARSILCKHKIDPYISCANLVVSQNRCHSKEYAKIVFETLDRIDKSPAGNRVAIIIALGQLGELHKLCQFGSSVNPITDE